MSLLEYFALQSRYNAWVNQRLYDACATLSDTERKQDRGAFFRSIHATWNHILLGDRLWLGRLKDVPVQYQQLDLELYSNFTELRAAQTASDEELECFIQGLDDAGLQRRIAFRSLSTGQDKILPVEIMLTTLFIHKIHHRGQITAMLSMCGCDYGAIDFICAPGIA